MRYDIGLSTLKTDFKRLDYSFYLFGQYNTLQSLSYMTWISPNQPSLIRQDVAETSSKKNLINQMHINFGERSKIAETDESFLLMLGGIDRSSEGERRFFIEFVDERTYEVHSFLENVRPGAEQLLYVQIALDSQAWTDTDRMLRPKSYEKRISWQYAEFAACKKILLYSDEVHNRILQNDGDNTTDANAVSQTVGINFLMSTSTNNWPFLKHLKTSSATITMKNGALQSGAGTFVPVTVRINYISSKSIRHNYVCFSDVFIS
ncbi:hypothetical protein RF11_08280 [Thelohanellus kitauei]|uniref:Uncharacterized protein n=1 Tax=Thelohanellus kitauei TaxID=669202 RepID=A0A0C2MUS8_THEKT|nr:hypothetical protein RF11_08280 [Thelohanellus kitauei]